MTSSSTCVQKEFLKKTLIPLVVLLSFTLANFHSLLKHEDLVPLDDPVPNVTSIDVISIGNSTGFEPSIDDNHRNLIINIQSNSSTAKEESTAVNKTIVTDKSTIVNRTRQSTRSWERSYAIVKNSAKEETTIVNNTAKDARVIASSLIPRRLIFTYPENLLQVKTPQYLHDNVQRTIQLYADAWGIENKSNVDVLFLLDSDCIHFLEQVEPRLVPIFKGERAGPYKADMCRLAALYIHGGYYLDVDIEPVKALNPEPDVDFITAKMTNGCFFQAVMATPAGHPILKSALESMILDWYMIPIAMIEYNRTEFDYVFYRGSLYSEKRFEHIGGLGLNHTPKEILMGPMTLRLAFEKHQNVTTPWLLNEEDNGQLKLYPDLVRKETSWGCNYMVHDPANKAAYFYSRCYGTEYCPLKTKTKPLVVSTKTRKFVRL